MVVGARRQTADDRVVLGLGQTDLAGTFAAHGKSDDVVVLTRGRQREEFTHDARKLLGDKGIERIAVCHVGIAGELYRGHDNSDIVCVGITLDRGAALPHRFVVAHAVQKPYRTVTARRNLTLREDDLNGDVESVQRHGLIFDMHQCHIRRLLFSRAVPE